MDLSQQAIPSTSKQQPQLQCASASGDLVEKNQKKQAMHLPEPAIPSTSKEQPQMHRETLAEDQPKKVPRTQVNRHEDEKLRVLRHLKYGISKAKLSRFLKIPESTIRGWTKDKTLKDQLDKEDANLDACRPETPEVISPVNQMSGVINHGSIPVESDPVNPEWMPTPPLTPEEKVIVSAQVNNEEMTKADLNLYMRRWEMNWTEADDEEPDEKMSDEELRMHMRRWELYWLEEYVSEPIASDLTLDPSKKMRQPSPNENS